MFEQAKTVRQATVGGGTTATVAGSSSDFESVPGGANRDGIKGAHEIDPRITNRRDIEMIGVLTERLAHCERREAEARRETEEAQALLEEEQAAHLRAQTRIEQLEFEQGYLRAESGVLRAAARRTFHGGSAALYTKMTALQEREQGVVELREQVKRYLRAEDVIRRYIPRSLRKRVRKFLFGSTETR